jgi:tetratricopeptide (TPR) repeat protein
MHILLRVLVGTVALLAVIAAAPASRADWGACKANDPDQSIAACTRIIEGSGETAKDSAIARRFRGLAYQRKRDLDRAIADYDEAIRASGRICIRIYNANVG